MQSINMVAVTPAFMTALFGTAAACLGLAAWAVISGSVRTTALVLAGCVLYLVGTIGVTMVCNVPLNNRLAKLHPRDTGAAGLLGQVRHEVDRMEPCAHHRRSGRGGPADRRAQCLGESSQIGGG